MGVYFMEWQEVLSHVMVEMVVLIFYMFYLIKLPYKNKTNHI